MINLNYLAGFIDGEGWIGVYKSKPNSKQQKSPRYTLELGIGQIMRGYEMFKELEKQFGGHARIYSKPKNPKHQQQCRYIATGDTAKKILEKIRTKLILKQEQCELAIEFQNKKNKLNKKHNNFRGKLLPPDVIEEREDYYQMLKKLNS
jgi:hypothetical protein